MHCTCIRLVGQAQANLKTACRSIGQVVTQRRLPVFSVESNSMNGRQNHRQGKTTHSLSLHSTSRGRSQGNQTGIGFNDKHGAGNSMALQVPGIHTDALPRLIHGNMWNSVFRSVGQTGRSNGIDIGPTVSGGIGRSG